MFVGTTGTSFIDELRGLKQRKRRYTFSVDFAHDDRRNDGYTLGIKVKIP